MVQDCIERIIHVMVFLGLTITDAPPATSLPAMPQLKSAKIIPLAQTGCIGQALPLEPRRKLALAYPIALHAECDRHWSIQFTKTAVILCSDDCCMRAQWSGVCPSCAQLLCHPFIKGDIHRHLQDT
ncbi:hypothetical protein B0H14DRAFT_2606469 [Mycena olivaceomarginata]|nr:hypothetical protein B0H14DRAFT_2606469 [Mycena olivaceomarginata]